MINPEEAYIDDYGTCARTGASLYLAGGECSPTEVTDRLGLSPHMMRAKGQSGIWRGGKWRDMSTPSPANIWDLSTKDVVDSRDSLRHVDHLLDLLEGREAALEALRQDGYRTEIRVFWDSKRGHGGPRLTPATMARLAELGLTLWYDVYYSDPPDEPEPVEGHPGWTYLSL